MVIRREGGAALAANGMQAAGEAGFSRRGEQRVSVAKGIADSITTDSSVKQTRFRSTQYTTLLVDTRHEPTRGGRQSPAVRTLDVIPGR